MLTSLLVGVDGSSFGNAAVELGVRWAQQFNASLFGIGVIDQPTICSPEAVPLGEMAFKGHRDEALVAKPRQKIERALHAFSACCDSSRFSGSSPEAVRVVDTHKTCILPTFRRKEWAAIVRQANG